MYLGGSLVDHKTTEINAIRVFWGPQRKLYIVLRTYDVTGEDL